MRHKERFLLIFLLFASAVSPVFADGKLLRGEKWHRFEYRGTRADFYVAPNGNDRWSGKWPAPNATRTDGPFATLERARQAVRQLKRQVYRPKKSPALRTGSGTLRYIGSPHPLGSGRDILVLIRGGEYELRKPLLFTAADGGERVETNLPSGAFEYHKLKDYYVTYAAYPGETPILCGGRHVRHWTKRGSTWTARGFGKPVEKLVLNGASLTLARTPDSGYFVPAAACTRPDRFQFSDDELQPWPGLQSNRIIFLLRWHVRQNAIARVEQTTHTAYLSKPQPGILVVPPRYYVENVKALLNAPGEWFYDAQKNELLLIPPKDVTDPNRSRVVVPELKQLLIVKGTRERPVRNLRFYGLHFEAANSGRNALEFTFAHDCELVDSRISAVGGRAVFLGKGCTENRLLNNLIEDADQGGVALAGSAHPEDWRDIVSKNIFSFNRVENCGGTSVSASNTLFTTISHNEVSHTRGRFAISVGGWANLEEALDYGYRVEYNHVHHVLKGADDSGAIKTAGLTYDSFIRYNLIHDVKAGYFNNNVGIWFDNMSSGWVVERNILYNLEQGEMKLCAANLVDNIYRDNFVINPPQVAPEAILKGRPHFLFEKPEIRLQSGHSGTAVRTGDPLEIRCQVKNTGSTGLEKIDFIVDGKVLQSTFFPIVRHNVRTVTFVHRFQHPGEHRVAVGASPYISVAVTGPYVPVLFDKLHLSHTIAPAGEPIVVRAVAVNRSSQSKRIDARLKLDGRVVAKKEIYIPPDSSTWLEFAVRPPAGTHRVQIGNSPAARLVVFNHRPLDLTTVKWKTTCSGTARPCTFDIQPRKNLFVIRAAGTDFFHAEDSYGAAYPAQKIRGNFVATVQVKGFSKETPEWFRAGIFVRNDLTKSFDTRPGSPGSVLLFTTPARAGMNWDEFGNGCMHQAKSQNLPENVHFPVWLKLIRRGNIFTGLVSLDGKHWIIQVETPPLHGVAPAVDLGLAAGSANQKPYSVTFENLTIETEDGK